MVVLRNIGQGDVFDWIQIEIALGRYHRIVGAHKSSSQKEGLVFVFPNKLDGLACRFVVGLVGSVPIVANRYKPAMGHGG